MAYCNKKKQKTKNPYRFYNFFFQKTNIFNKILLKVKKTILIHNNRNFL
jgi:hypothetical protein